MFFSCNREDDIISLNELDLLEEKYGVEIQNEQNVVLTAEDLAVIEEMIIEMQQYFHPFSCEKMTLESASNGLQSRAVEKGEASAWAYNVSWLHVGVEVENDKNIEITTWLTGITLYSFEQLTAAHDFVPNKKQKRINVDLTMLLTLNLIDVLGINLQITEQMDARGVVTLGSDDGILTVKRK